MKSRTILFFVLITNMMFSQTHRFIYEYKFKIDSTNTTFETTKMTLDINPEEIKFYSYQYIENDSLNKVRNYRSNFWDNNFPAIKRNKNSFKNLNFVLFDAYFSYETEDKIIWTLTNETKKSDDYNLQKATTTFGGRNWIAWFAKEITINEGPYKFRGLPGLIFEISDDKDNFHFNLVKSWKLDKTYKTDDFIESFAGQRAIKTNEKFINKKSIENFNDPLREMRETYDPNIEGEYRVYGVKITSKEQFKELTIMAQDRMRREYNPLEIDKAIKYPIK